MAIPLEDLKRGDVGNSYIDFESEEETEFLSLQDQSVLEKWDFREIKLDEKLGRINEIIDDLKTLTKNQADLLQVRTELVEANREQAHNVNAELEKQNENIAEMLEKLRAPNKLCMDFCLLLVLLGLISIIIKLALNGKK